VTVPVTLTRREGLRTGRYEGKLVVRLGAVGGRATLVVQAETKPLEAASAWTLAVFAILVGAILGALLKWLTETGSKLAGLSNRLTQIGVLLRPLGEYVPLGLQQLLLQTQTALAQRDVQTAEAALNALTQEKLTAVLAAAQNLQKLDGEVSDQRKRIDQHSSLSADEKQKLLRIADVEHREIQEATGPIWPEPAASRDERVALADGIRSFSFFLGRFMDTNRLGDQGVPEVLAAFAAGEWSKAREAMDKIGAAAAGALPGAAAAEQEPPAGHPQAGWYESLIGWAIRHYFLLAQLLVIVGVVVVGLLLLFDPLKTFAESPGQDWLKLFAWGFGAQTTGVTLAQLGGKLVGAGPKFE
jgi:hypothetical protein